jgi:hypothetical protein
MSTSDDLQQRQQRAAINQSRFRALNEAIQLRHEGSAFDQYVCECAQKTCVERLSLAVDEYEEARKVPTHFIVAHGHVVLDVEVVLRETARYQVVEKIEHGAELARALDPRSPR